MDVVRMIVVVLGTACFSMHALMFVDDRRARDGFMCLFWAVIVCINGWAVLA